MTDLPRGLKVSLFGFLFAIVGAVLGFSGFYADLRWLSFLGYAIVAFGVLVGITGILYGWIKEGKHAIKTSRQATHDLSSIVTKQFKSRSKEKNNNVES